VDTAVLAAYVIGLSKGASSGGGVGLSYVLTNNQAVVIFESSLGLGEAVSVFGSGAAAANAAGSIMTQASSNGSESGSKEDPSQENIDKWDKGTFNSAEDSLKYHYEQHGDEVGAENIDQYVRKAEGFAQNLKGATKSYPDGGTAGAVRYTKNGKYIIMSPDGKILSYGLAR